MKMFRFLQCKAFTFSIFAQWVGFSVLSSNSRAAPHLLLIIDFQRYATLPLLSPDFEMARFGVHGEVPANNE